MKKRSNKIMSFLGFVATGLLLEASRVFHRIAVHKIPIKLNPHHNPD